MSEVAEEWLDGIAARLGCQISAGTAPGGEETTVRDLLATFGHMRRGKRAVAEIREALERRGLRTEPDFEYEWVDDPVSLVLDDGAEVSGLAKAVDPTVRVGVLPAAHVDLISVKRDDPLMRATTLMRIGDFSQLPVMQDERDVKGVVSWKSIGVVYARGGEPESVVECMDEAQIIDSWKPLEEAAELICTHDYVLVRDKERRITGSSPGRTWRHNSRNSLILFLLIGEIEHHLRNLIRGKAGAERRQERVQCQPRIGTKDTKQRNALFA